MNVAMSIGHCRLPRVFRFSRHEARLMKKNTKQLHRATVHVTQQSQQATDITKNMHSVSASRVLLHAQVNSASYSHQKGK